MRLHIRKVLHPFILAVHLWLVVLCVFSETYALPVECEFSYLPLFDLLMLCQLNFCKHKHKNTHSVRSKHGTCSENYIFKKINKNKHWRENVHKHLQISTKWLPLNWPLLYLMFQGTRLWGLFLIQEKAARLKYVSNWNNGMGRTLSFGLMSCMATWMPLLFGKWRHS